MTGLPGNVPAILYFREIGVLWQRMEVAVRGAVSGAGGQFLEVIAVPRKYVEEKLTYKTVYRRTTRKRYKHGRD